MTRHIVTAALVLGAIVACRGGESPGPVLEAATPDCPTTGERLCRSEEDCPPTLHCTAGRCYANQAGCPCSQEGTDCGSAAHCTRMQCYANAAGNPCTTTAECGPRAHCTVDTCYANASGSPCNDNADCGASSACVSGRCN